MREREKVSEQARKRGSQQEQTAKVSSVCYLARSFAGRQVALWARARNANGRRSLLALANGAKPLTGGQSKNSFFSNNWRKVSIESPPVDIARQFSLLR